MTEVYGIIYIRIRIIFINVDNCEFLAEFTSVVRSRCLKLCFSSDAKFVVDSKFLPRVRIFITDRRHWASLVSCTISRTVRVRHSSEHVDIHCCETHPQECCIRSWMGTSTARTGWQWCWDQLAAGIVLCPTTKPGSGTESASLHRLQDTRTRCVLHTSSADPYTLCC